MSRRARLALPNVPMHIVQRGNNRQACFFADQDYRFYLEWLNDYANHLDCQIHAYVLMTNHVHLLVSASAVDGASKLMKALGQRYAQHVNRTYRRSGTVWEGRFRSCLTQDENYMLACQRYIELNPVRAGMVEHPADYPWSSYRINAQGANTIQIAHHALYLALGADPLTRQAAYRALFRDELAPGIIDAIREATNGNFSLGDAPFGQQIAFATGRRAMPGQAGRPRKPGASKNSGKTVV